MTTYICKETGKLLVPKAEVDSWMDDDVEIIEIVDRIEQNVIKDTTVLDLYDCDILYGDKHYTHCYQWHKQITFIDTVCLLTDEEVDRFFRKAVKDHLKIKCFKTTEEANKFLETMDIESIKDIKERSRSDIMITYIVKGDVL